ncbi:MAG: FHA domain-containing protein [Polyangiaceae bacterium]
MTGKSSGSTVRCERCGRDNPPGLRFCRDCGNRIAASEAEVPAVVPAPAAAPAPVPRPAAPAFDFGARAEPTMVGCGRCGANNPGGGRFCFNCGNALGAPEATAPPAVGAQAPPRATTPQPVAPAAAPEQPNVACARCRGSNPRHATTCQFCGARLNQESHEAPTPATGGSTQRNVAARLVVIAQDGTPGRQYPLTEDQTDIGREEGSILLPSDPYVSPRHARVFQRAGRFFVRDLASVNGVYVRIRSAERLQNADLVLIGLEVLRFEVVSDAEKGLGPATERGTRVFGSPALPRYARLCQRTVEGATRDIVYLGRDETVIGRESGDLVFTNDPFMSRRHAVFLRDATTNIFLLQDLGSSNGTYLAIRGEHELAHGDHVRIGQHLFRLDVDGNRARS